MEKILVNKEYLLQKFPGKGGWTYADIPEISADKNSPFGWVKVKGNIDEYPFKNFRLQPMGNGKLFFPLKAEIRKKIKKQAGDYVKIVLYQDVSPPDIPAELQLCLRMEPGAYKRFLQFTEGEQKGFIDWIYSAKTDETKVNRIAVTIDKALKQQNLLSK